ncbi:MAG: methyltransferase domain-containing protein [Deltaproteobacteria bacterium]|uniref:Methyltransferase domain-containing protein n=1 Tax=Candidatus Zymogenus saltonus TaxID=2844893 RepID=A0A9D8KIC1_9DELT|nr:methyltransferase domain-containing protein [Candidatus Zymogenus saltonus]
MSSNFEKGKYSVIKDPEYGYMRIDPVPTKEYLADYYKSSYYDLIKKGEGAESIKRLHERSDETKSEVEWLQKTFYSDIDHILRDLLPGEDSRRILEVGCGTGDLLSFMVDKGWDAMGIEPSAEATEHYGTQGKLVIYNCFFDEFVKEHGNFKGIFDAILLMNVLEHVPHPDEFLNMVKSLLKPKKGIVCIKVPNDFSLIQELATKVIHEDRWWVAIPDHVNYFNIDTLNSFLQKLGFVVLERLADFPMELFLLLGYNYVKDRSLGKMCHKKRKDFEMSLPGDLRRSFYRKIVSSELGRNITFFAQISE